MPRSARGSTTEAGYGYDHQQDRRELLDRHVDGTRCAECGKPMYRSQRLHADHSTPRALGGTKADRLLHGWCNEARGARLGNRMRSARKHGRPRPAQPPSPATRPRLPEW